jgi:aquaporin Z
MAKYIVETIGTFFLVLTIGLNVLGASPESALFAPVAIGTVLAVMIFAGGHISGGHFNPAVTLGVFLRGRCPAADVPGYWMAQVVGGVLAALVAGFLKPDAAPTPGSLTVGPALVAEFLFTFALVYVVLNVATAKGTAGNSFYGWAIGFTVLVGAYSVGAISGGAFNPAVAVGLCAMKLAAWSNLWIYLVAHLVGGTVAAVVFKLTHPDDR